MTDEDPKTGGGGFGWNHDKPVLSVRHQFMPLDDAGESAFRLSCVVCGGILLIRRDQTTGALLRRDYCVKCGQRYVYLDDMICGEPLGDLAAEPELILVPSQ